MRRESCENKYMLRRGKGTQFRSLFLFLFFSSSIFFFNLRLISRFRKLYRWCTHTRARARTRTYTHVQISFLSLSLFVSFASFTLFYDSFSQNPELPTVSLSSRIFHRASRSSSERYDSKEPGGATRVIQEREND